jgi:hypothetical protein
MGIAATRHARAVLKRKNAGKQRPTFAGKKLSFARGRVARSLLGS